jgi:3'-phosphoadenosine 5'-phosphosulfate sulfotransferase (PAPS reductase)/FAD synthetase
METWLDTIATVRATGAETLVSFSRGKDSLATYLALRDKFDRIACYTYEVVPGLEFVEDSLQYYEQKMGMHIHRYPAPGLFRLLNNAVYQPHDRLDLIARLDLPPITHNLLQEFACGDAGLDYEKVYNAVGMRSKDSVQRAFSIQHNGTINHSRRIYYPIHDWDKQQVIDIIKNAGWKLPIDYRYFSASFDGLYLKFLYPIKLYFPRDYEKICTWFPYAELECLRYEAAIRAGKQPAYIPPTGAKIYGH